MSIMKLRALSFQILTICLILGSIESMAQPGGRPGGGRGGFDPDEMIKREKQNLYKAVVDLNNDQKLLLDGIYDEFALSFKELRDEMRQTRNFQAMRPKMQALQQEKNGLIKDVLNENQFDIYMGLIEERRRQRREMAQRGDSTRRRRRNALQELPADTVNVQPPQNQ